MLLHAVMISWSGVAQFNAIKLKMRVRVYHCDTHTSTQHRINIQQVEKEPEQERERDGKRHTKIGKLYGIQNA